MLKFLQYLIADICLSFLLIDTKFNEIDARRANYEYLYKLV